MESWRKVLRDGLLPLLSDDAVYAIYFALANDRPELIQGASVFPPPLLSCAERKCQGGCLLSYGQWKAMNLTTVGEVEEQFARLCYDLDNRMGEPAASRWLLDFFDGTPRDSMILALLPEFRAELEKREKQDAQQAKVDSCYDDCQVV